MKAADFLILNGELYPSEKPLISADNRSFKYGDGFFETMKMIRGKIILQDLHFERLFSSLHTMQFDKPGFFTADYLSEQIQKLTSKNNHNDLARIRITVFRSNGGLYDVNQQPNFIIQSYAPQVFPSYNEQGLSIAIYEDARKATDAFSHIKSNNYLPYAMAAIWCKKMSLDDALLLNGHDNIAEATTSNIFVVKNGVIQTPALSEGCIAGVTRRYLLRCLQEENISYKETQITTDDVEQADELFLTNAGFYIQWIRQCGTANYTNQISQFLYNRFINPLLIS